MAKSLEGNVSEKIKFLDILKDLFSRLLTGQSIRTKLKSTKELILALETSINTIEIKLKNLDKEWHILDSEIKKDLDSLARLVFKDSLVSRTGKSFIHLLKNLQSISNPENRAVAFDQVIERINIHLQKYTHIPILPPLYWQLFDQTLDTLLLKTKIELAYLQNQKDLEEQKQQLEIALGQFISLRSKQRKSKSLKLN